ncbi:MAG: gamma-glutamylcyclotransferase family protein [Janthinobacterium lividum]
MLYFAYGSNLHRAGMLSRCPAAVPLGRAVLQDHALVFRQWADILPIPGASVAGGLWRITPDCAAALDEYEDVASGLYHRLHVLVHPEGADEAVEALAYRMNATSEAPPHAAYLAAILQGCRDFGLDETAVSEAAARRS